METFLRPQHHSSSLITAAGSRLPGPCPSISWRWRRQQQHSTLQQRQCHQLQQDYSAVRTRHHLDEADSRLQQNAGILHPSKWRDFFLGYSNAEQSSQQQQAWMDQADKLKEEVAQMIAASSTTSSLHERLHLIDVLERLCLDYLFEEQINAALSQIQAVDVSDYDLSAVALWFYLLRKHRYHVSPDVFVRFKDVNGGFSANNPVDLLNLYNAAHLRTHGEIILDEAILFTRKRLHNILPFVERSLAREIKSALEIPLPRRVRIYESKHYISTYERDATHHEKVLQLAKLNSNIMQLHHQQELNILTRWWEDIKIESVLPFARDRIVECFLWMSGVYFQPCHSRARIILTMTIAIVTLLDDICDSYASPEECDIITKCIESWDLKVTHDLPECIRYALGKVFDSYEYIESMLQPEEKYRMMYLRHSTIDLVRSFNVEAKMLQEGYVPNSVEEQLKVSLISGGCPILACACFVGMDDIATTDIFDWVSSAPKMVEALSIILRIVDDLQPDEREHVIPHVATSIDSYMKEHNVSIEVAREKLHLMKEESWKDLNSEWLNPNNAYPKQLLERIYDMTKAVEFMYNQEDKFANCRNLDDLIQSLLSEPLTIAI